MKPFSPEKLIDQVIETANRNINFIFLVEKTHSSQNLNSRESPLDLSASTGAHAPLILKQAAPYLRLVGEKFPLKPQRLEFEYQYLSTMSKIPEISHLVVRPVAHEETLHLLLMQYIPPPAVVFRSALIKGLHFSHTAQDVGFFLAHALLRTSCFALSSLEFRNNVAYFSKNAQMCETTENVVFCEPLTDHPNNKYNSEIASKVGQMRSNSSLKSAVKNFLYLFQTKTEALIHGDLHTGSILASENVTKVFDAEFCFYGPMGYDTGAFLGNLLLNFFSQPADSTSTKNNLCTQITSFWIIFCQEARNLWQTRCSTRDFWSSSSEHHLHFFEDFLQRLWRETVGFSATKMIRRIIGIAHVEDLESIKDTKLHAVCELRALSFAEDCLVHPEKYDSLEALIKVLESL